MTETYMEKALLKLARQINAYDEASLMSLWEQYADKVRHFEPTKRWEEAVLVFNLIQSIRMKNQLFNFNWARSRMPDDESVEIDLAALTAPEVGKGEPVEDDVRPDIEEAESSEDKKARKGKLLTLTPKNEK